MDTELLSLFLYLIFVNSFIVNLNRGMFAGLSGITWHCYNEELHCRFIKTFFSKTLDVINNYYHEILNEILIKLNEEQIFQMKVTSSDKKNSIDKKMS